MRKLSVHTIPALVVAALFASGILAGSAMRTPTRFSLILTALAFSVSVVVFIGTKNNPGLGPFRTLSLLILVFGLGITAIQIKRAVVSIPDIQSSNSVEVIGRIVEPPARYQNRTRFTMRAESVTDSAGSRVLETNILVTVVRRKKDSVEIAFSYGSRLRMRGYIARPSAERNPGEFDSRKYLEAQGISLIMRVRGFENVSVYDSSYVGTPYTWFVKMVVVPARQYALSLIDSTIGGEEGELLKGIFIGERGGISSATRTAFTNSGISHILAVSGSNVVVVLAFFTIAFNFLRLSRSVNIVATIIMVLFYMVLTGSQPPIVRATVMTVVYQLGKLLGERSNGLNSLGVAALLILGFDARQLFDVGFQLSFAAVLSLVYGYPIVKRWLPNIQENSWWKSLFRHALDLATATFVATLGTLPMIAIYFGKVSIVGLLTNIIIVPTVGASVILGFISSLVGWSSYFVADAFAAVNWLLLKFTLWVASFSGGLSWAYVETHAFRPIHSFPFYCFLGVLFHMNKPPVARKFFLGLLSALNIAVIVPASAVDNVREGMLRVSFIDVGQGDATLIEFPDGKTMLIDAGPKSAEFDSGERIVAPFLNRRGISTIDYLIPSHPHNDHIGGFPYVFSKFVVKRVIEAGQPSRDPVYVEYVRAVRNEQCPVETVRAAMSARNIGGATLYVLYPTQTFIDPDTTHPHENLNNTSVVCKLVFGEVSVLMTGDAEMAAEDEMSKYFGTFLESTVLKAGHHGSITSSSEQFLGYVKPKFAIVCVGAINRFNHPSEEIIQRFRDMNTEVLRTDEEGAVIFETDGKTLHRIEWR